MKETDGRRVRATRTASAIVTALHALLEEGAGHPTAAEIASRAGVAVRSIGQHFRSREALLLALAAFHAARIPEPVPPPPRSPFDVRLAHFVSARAKALEGSATLRRAAQTLTAESKAISKLLAEVARRRRDELRRWLGPELRRASAPLAAAVEALTSGATWDELRGQQRLSARSAEQVMSQTLHRLLR